MAQGLRAARRTYRGCIGSMDWAAGAAVSSGCEPGPPRRQPRVKSRRRRLVPPCKKGDDSNRQMHELADARASSQLSSPICLLPKLGPDTPTSFVSGARCASTSSAETSSSLPTRHDGFGPFPLSTRAPSSLVKITLAKHPARAQFRPEARVERGRSSARRARRTSPRSPSDSWETRLRSLRAVRPQASFVSLRRVLQCGDDVPDDLRRPRVDFCPAGQLRPRALRELRLHSSKHLLDHLRRVDLVNICQCGRELVRDSRNILRRQRVVASPRSLASLHSPSSPCVVFPNSPCTLLRKYVPPTSGTSLLRTRASKNSSLSCHLPLAEMPHPPPSLPRHRGTCGCSSD